MRAWRWLLLPLALLLLVLALVLGLVLTAGSASGLGWLLPRLAAGELQGASGSLWTGLKAERLRVWLPAWQVEIRDLDWQPARPVSLRGALHIGSLKLRSRPDAPPSPPMREQELLAALRLPVDLELLPLRIDHIQVDALQLQALKVQRLALVRGSAAVEALRIEWPQPEGALPLSASLQLAATGQLRLQAQAREPSRALEAQLQAQGRLGELPLSLALRQGEGSLQLEARVAPFAGQPLFALQGRLQALNPQAIDTRLPAGHWDGQIALSPVDAKGPQLQLQLDARNARALRLDEGGWPLRRLQARALLDPTQWQRLQIQQFDAELGNARQGAGRLQLAPQGLPLPGQALRSELRLDALRLPALDARWPALQLAGQLQLTRARLDQGALNFDTQLRATPLPGLPPLLAREAGWRLSAQAALDGSRLHLQQLQLRELLDSPSLLRGEAEIDWSQGLQAKAQLDASAWRLRLPPWEQPSQIDGRVEADLRQAAARNSPWLGRLQLQLREATRLAGLPLQGEAQWSGEAQAASWRLALQQATSQGPPLTLSASGSQPPLRQPAELARAQAWLPEAAQWQLPALAALQPLWQPWLRDLQGTSQGSLQARDGRLQQLQIALQGLRLQTDAKATPLQLQALKLGLDENRRLRVQLEQLQLPPQRLQKLSLEGQLDATASETRVWQLQAQGSLAGRELQLQGNAAAPRRRADGSWELPALALSLLEGETRWLELAGGQITGRMDAGGQASLSLPRLRLAGQALNLRQAELAWGQGRDPQLQLALDGSPELQAWLALLQPEAGWRGDLRARLQLAVQTGDGAPALRLSLQREGGDLELDRLALGLQQLELLLQQDRERRVQASALLRGSGLGEAQAQLRTGPRGESLEGSLRASLPALQALRPWLQVAAPGLLLNGKAQADLRLSGSLAAPRARGTAEAELSQLLHAPSGAGLGSATLRLNLDEQGLQIAEFKAQGLGEQGGSLEGSGGLRVQEGGNQLSGELRLQADKLRVLNRFDRRLVASGELAAQLLPNSLRLRGQLQADEGVFDIGGQSGAPSLDEDVRVLRADAAAAAPTRKRGAPRFTRDVDVKVDLGQRLRIAGRGLASRLSGQLAFVEQGGKPLQATGRVELHGGRYRAYGQNLEIETGVLRFTGELDNPRIELLAIRPNLEQRVGVQVGGSVNNLRVRLYSEPDMADSDKLAWLLLGRGPDDLGRTDTAILQRAALAVLAGENSNPAADLMDRIGLTELSVSQGDDAGTTLRLGAQLSRRWSLGYERSLNAASGSWQLIYRLGQRFRLRAQSGEASAVDLLWLWRFD